MNRRNRESHAWKTALNCAFAYCLARAGTFLFFLLLTNSRSSDLLIRRFVLYLSIIRDIHTYQQLQIAFTSLTKLHVRDVKSICSKNSTGASRR